MNIRPYCHQHHEFMSDFDKNNQKEDEKMPNKTRSEVEHHEAFLKHNGTGQHWYNASMFSYYTLSLQFQTRVSSLKENFTGICTTCD